MSNQPTLLQTQLQTQLQTSLHEQYDEAAAHSDCWGLLIPRSRNLPGGVVRLTKRSPSPGAPAVKEHSFKIGSGIDNDFVLSAPNIGIYQCILTWFWSGHGGEQPTRDNTYVYVEDCGSNRTFINGRFIGRGRKARLCVGDELSFGSSSQKIGGSDYRYLFRLPPAAPEVNGGVLDRYDLGPILGEGAFGTVHRALDRVTGEWYACKVVSKSRFAQNPRKLEIVRREVAVLRGLDHPHICKLVDHFENESTIWLVLELVEGGNLAEAVAKEGIFSEHKARRLIAEVCYAMEYSHSKSIVHRDLKPENILLANSEPGHVKVADFGLAKDVGADSVLRTFCGTPVYLAPEIALCKRGESYTELVDSWSMGVIAWSILTNSVPFVDDGGRPATRFERQKIDWSQLACRGLSTECIDWIKRMMELDPIRRMTIRQALDHPWLAAEPGPQVEEAPSASTSAWTLVHGASTGTVVPSSPLPGSSHSTASSWIHLSREVNVPRGPAPSLASGQARLQSTASLSSMPERGKLDRRLGRRFAPIPATPLRKCHSVV
ncbi:hypothetical protein FRC08_001056 [Ceratobasidium sp. 394]|nr:hypothetical protein FRC08_001056 [Ceratobasidium sp. 394]KAG9100712.1 hypothetical protein FS749_013401 [Ceratobasidium sp. UAMH 11750]